MKERLDVLLVNKGFFTSREKAKASIMAGIIFVDNERVDKAGTMIDCGSDIFVKENLCPYVSRGGLKLEKAIKTFGFSLKDAVCADMGASTGGFTDCMLKSGAKKVYAIDVGYGQLDYKLRIDDRVVNIEKTNIRYMDTELIKEPVDFISIDVSFISLDLIFPVAAKVLSDTGKVVALVKPQFEAGREQVGKKGIVRDPDVHESVIKKAAEFGEKVGLHPCGLTFSPVTGAKGNIEYLMMLSRGNTAADMETLIKDTVELSHKELT
ncbi:MAG: TlyA family RNA methyltransferase [Eubacteriaceae bacterium]|nr:TlyA family RNA methyltransferase [Eubacteriaceae bacterium]